MSYKAGVYDVYDDHGKFLLEAFGSVQAIPELFKTASADVDDTTNPNLFALVLVENGEPLKKYAMTDPANTAVSVLYFLNKAQNLPEEAQKTAAANLVDACEFYGIEAPAELYEIAGEFEPETNIIDVSGEKLAHVPGREEEVVYAIERADGSRYYPLKDISSVKVADEYFQRNANQFVPRERREYAVKVAMVADEYGYPVSEIVAQYAGDRYNPDLKGYLSARAFYVYDNGSKRALTKLAAAAGTVPPEEFASALEMFDRMTGIDRMWDSKLPDPWFTTFTKTAAEVAPANPTFEVGFDRVTAEDLIKLSQRGLATINSYFGPDFAQAYSADPVKQFMALPLPQKKLIARLATETINDASIGS